MALMLDVDETLARYGSIDGQVAARCTGCMGITIVLASVMRLSGCEHCSDGQQSFPLPRVTDQFRTNSVRRLYGRFRAAETTTGIRRPRDQNLLQWLGFTADELALHVSEMMARGCYYCGREIVEIFHVAHVEPISKVDDVLALWQTFQLHNVVTAHADCNLQNGHRGRADRRQEIPSQCLES